MAHHGEPLVRLRLLRSDDVPDSVDQNLSAAAWDRVEARVAQTGDRLPQRQLAAPRDVLDLRRREGVQVDVVARLDRAEQILVVIDAEIRVVSALHQEPGAAERECLLDLLEDDRLRQEVALTCVAGAAVEGTEVAVRVTDVRVVEVAVDDEGDAIGIRLAVPDLIRGAPNGNEIA